MPDAVSARGEPASQIHPHRAREFSAPTAPGWSWPRFFRNAIVTAAVVSLGVWYAVEGVIPNIVPKRFGVVEAGAIYRSGELTAAATRRVVSAHGIRTIIDLGAHEPGTIEESRAGAVARSLGVERLRFDLEGDGRGDPDWYVRALRIMADPGAQPVLVHCSAGAQRTGCAVALHRMIREGWTLDRAIEEARRYDHDPRDNPHVIGMIEQWRGEIESALIEERLIADNGG